MHNAKLAGSGNIVPNIVYSNIVSNNTVQYSNYLFRELLYKSNNTFAIILFLLISKNNLRYFL